MSSLKNSVYEISRESDAQLKHKLYSDMVGLMLNGGFSNKAFCENMTNEHRTLQQAFTRLCFEWIKTCASDDYRTDGRNEHSHEVCKKVWEAFKDDIVLPFI